MKKLWLALLIMMFFFGYMLSNAMTIYDDYRRLNGTGVPVTVLITKQKEDTRRDSDGYKHGETRYRLYGEYSYNGKTYDNVFVGHSYFDDKIGSTRTVTIDPQKPWKMAPDSNGIMLMILAIGLFSITSAVGLQSFAENIMEDGEEATRDARYRAAMLKVLFAYAGLLLILALVYSNICQTLTALIAFVIVQLAILLICQHAIRAGKKKDAKPAEQFRSESEIELN